MSVLVISTPVAIAKKKALENAKTGENGKKSKNRDEDLGINLV